MSIEKVEDEEKFLEVGHRLVTWYKLHQRSLPWRQSKDPYHILVSETMLQQTRVETVIPYYYRFLESFPTIAELAKAEEQDVLKIWQGLGYYSRARNLQKAAQIVMQEYHGVIPREPLLLAKLPGIGPYTSGAVASIAFGLPVPAVDGNVLRVVTRYRGISDPIQMSATKKQVTDILKTWIFNQSPDEFTQSVMELGATVCLPNKPNCLFCPLSTDCVANLQGITAIIPVKIRKKKRKIVSVAALWIEQRGQLLVEQRPGQGLLQNMWQLPALEFSPDTEESLQMVGLSKMVAEVCGDDSWSMQVSDGQIHYFTKVAEERHIFTHVEWEVSVYRPVGLSMTEQQLVNENRSLQWVDKKALSQLVWPRVYEKVFASILGIQVRDGSQSV